MQNIFVCLPLGNKLCEEVKYCKWNCGKKSDKKTSEKSSETWSLPCRIGPGRWRPQIKVWNPKSLIKKVFSSA